MFIMQQQQQQRQGLGARKRVRDDDSDMTGGLGFAEHRGKRPQNLPLWTTAPPQHWPAPLAVAPAALDPPSHSSCAATMSSGSYPDAEIGMGMMDVDMDMDADAGPGAAPEPSPSASALPSGGRLPTPIQPSFPVQVRGTSWGAGPGPALHHHHRDGVMASVGHEPSSVGGGGGGLCLVRPVEDADMGAVPRAMEADTEWHSVKNRRLPSPISEADDCTSPSVNTCVGSPDMVLSAGAPSRLPSWADGTWMADTRGPEAITEQQQQQVRRQQQQQQPIPLQHQNTWHAGVPCPVRTAAAEDDDGSGGGSVTPTATSPARKGHTRSRHTLNSWTWQPGMQKSFSIGYRADCEKCRAKVPGHFNHIIIS